MLWTVLLEKAIAKFAGSYSLLHGGNITWAWQALTGVEIQVTYHRSESGWQKYKLLLEGQKGQKAEIEAGLRFSTPYIPEGAEGLKDNEIFAAILSWDKMNYCMCAVLESSVDEDQAKAKGLRTRHAYSLLSAVQVKEICLVQLRNPWGHTEWNGAWSDGSSEWRTYPEVGEATGHTEENDGVFWMCMDDFVNYFDLIYVLPQEVKSERAGRALKKTTCRFRECAVLAELFAEVDKTASAEVQRILFDYFDLNADNKVSQEELASVLSTLIPDLTQKDLKGLFKSVDHNQDGFLDCKEFLDFLLQ